MRFKNTINFFLALLLLAPMLPWLAVFPQNPDGAEMLNTALMGGVMHPSGMPLQAWVNQVFVAILPAEPGWTLSLVSWLGLLGTVFFFLQTLGVWNFSWLTRIVSAVAFAYFPIVWRMALQPEKYTWITFTFCLCFHAYSLNLSERRRRWLIYSACATALAIAQHSVALIFIPSLIFILASHLSKKPQDTFFAFLSLILGVVMSSLFYLSLLLLRRPLGSWIDWGQLQTYEDVWNHFIRRDFSVLDLHHQASSGPMVDGLTTALQQILSLNFSLPLILLGMLAIMRSHKAIAFLVGSTFLGAVVALSLARMPALDLLTVNGYMERYPMILIPTIMLFYASGIEALLKILPSFHVAITAVLILSMGMMVSSGRADAYAVNNNFIDLFRHEVSRELPANSLLFTSSDFEGFYGFPCAQGTCFPLKNLFNFDWYRNSVAPNLEPRIRNLISQLGGTSHLQDLFRAAVTNGYPLVSTSASAMVSAPDLMRSAEQAGLIWIFSRQNQDLYTNQILNNSLYICQSLDGAWKGLPKTSNYFAQDILKNFQFAFRGAADFLISTQKVATGDLANQLAASLEPGIDPEVWRRLCRSYTTRLSSK